MSLNTVIHIVSTIGNPFDVFRTESLEHRMAQLRSDEPQIDDVPYHCKPVAVVVPCDIGDEDKKVVVYDVWNGNTLVSNGWPNATVAAKWANANGYRLLPLFP